MSYCHKDGLKCATQFHPENKYSENGNQNWIDNFVSYAKRYHDHKIDNAVYTVEECAEMINSRMDSCKENPFSILEETALLECANQNWIIH